jgi:hypothetical protein
MAAVSSSEGKLTVAMTKTMAALMAKATAATCPWRWARSARKKHADGAKAEERRQRNIG